MSEAVGIKTAEKALGIPLVFYFPGADGAKSFDREWMPESGIFPFSYTL
ncbi:hypothetical protein [Angelakisella massiliensis]|nr:hypothetical protein [Angelakisella massiliensis]